MSVDLTPSKGGRSRWTARFFAALNSLVEPMVRRGVGSPVVGPGLVVVETTGRKTGTPRRVPLVGFRLADSVIISTVRTDSEWLRNLESNPRSRVWSAGKVRDATATVQRLSSCGSANLRTAPRHSVGGCAARTTVQR